ncbi:MAG TPA: Ig-like domain-containing protein, partial [Longimicrobium sp.]|nr:Ig-like domain-containing protein [Longimicrobium sp.]
METAAPARMRASRTVRRTAWLLLLAAAVSCDSPTDGRGGPPATLDAVSGDAQTAAAGTELPQPLVVRVTDERGRPVRGQEVSWVVTQGGGSVSPAEAVTDADGLASARWTLGTVAVDSQRVEAQTGMGTERGLLVAAFRADAVPGAPAFVTPVGPPLLAGIAGLPLLDSVAVKVADEHGNPVPGAAVVWTVRSGGGSVSPATSAADSTGTARALWTLGTQGAQTLEAAAGVGVATAFAANLDLPLGAVLQKVSGDGQSAPSGAPLPQPVVVRVVRGDGRPVPGVAVAWSPSPGTRVSAPATVTDASGHASVVWTMGGAPGLKGLQASIAPGQLVGFTATATLGPPASLTVVSGNAQAAPPGATLHQPVVVRVTDAEGNPVPGVTVSFAAGGGGSANPATAQTDADGRAETRWTLGAGVGSHTLSITAGALSAQATATAPPPLAPARHTSAGARTTCAVASSGAASCWGFNQTGMVGDGSLADRLTPVPVSGGHTWAVVTVGGEHTCGITRDYTAWCWGTGLQGALGISTTGSQSPPVHSPVPHRVAGGHAWISISAGGDQTCGITWAGRAYCWGANFQGKLGLGFGDDVHRYAPAPVATTQTFFTVSTSGDDTCALTPSGEAWCWGYGYRAPAPVPGGIAFESVSVGAGQACGVSRAQGLYCWNPRFNGAPAPVAAGTSFASVSVGGFAGSDNPAFACARTVQGATLCWGNNESGQLGNGTTTPSATPVPVGPDPGLEAQSLDAGGAHACGMAADGTVYCWGRNDRGQLGTGDTGNRGSPTPTSSAAGPGTRALVAQVRGTVLDADGGRVLWLDPYVNTGTVKIRDRATGTDVTILSDPAGHP